MLISVKNLTKNYKTESGKISVSALKDISFEIEKGKVLGIIGESGSGKTTLVKILSRLEKYDCGIVEINGKDISLFRKKEFASAVQMIFQNPYASFNPKLTVGYSLSEALEKDCKNKKELISAKLTLVGISDDVFNKYPHQFSGGQRQRLAIARALLKEPEILIADEPFASLDAVSQKNITDIFIKIKENKKTNIVFITHDISSAFEISDRLLILKNGNIVKYGTIDDVKNDRTNDYVNELIEANYLLEQ